MFLSQLLIAHTKKLQCYKWWKLTEKLAVEMLKSRSSTINATGHLDWLQLHETSGGNTCKIRPPAQTMPVALARSSLPVYQLIVPLIVHTICTIFHFREHLQTDFSMLNVIVTLTSDPLPPSLASYYENYAMKIEAQNIIFFT